MSELTLPLTLPVHPGLFLLERLKPQFDMEASQALARLAPISAPGAGGGGHRKSSRQQRAAWVRQRLAAMRNSIKQQLVMAELLELTEGATVIQDGHVILMKGTIQVGRVCVGHELVGFSRSNWLCGPGGGSSSELQQQ
jgi:hypothetical protein